MTASFLSSSNNAHKHQIQKLSVVPAHKINLGNPFIGVELQGQEKEIAGEEIGKIQKKRVRGMTLMNMAIDQAYKLLASDAENMSRTGGLPMAAILSLRSFSAAVTFRPVLRAGFI